MSDAANALQSATGVYDSYYPRKNKARVTTLLRPVPQEKVRSVQLEKGKRLHDFIAGDQVGTP